MRKTTVTIITYRELEELIEKTYGHPFSFLEDQELSFSNYKLFDTNAYLKLEEGEEDSGELEAFKNNGDNEYGYLVDQLISDMAYKGVIEHGNYLVEVFW